MKTQTQIPGSPSRAPNRLGWLLLIPLLALNLPAQASGPEITIETVGDTNAMVSWQDPAEEYIVVWASTLDGPWTPCLESIERGTNLCQMAVCTTGECRYFKLARGQRFEETDWDLDGLTVQYTPPELSNDVTVEVTNGQLHVYGTSTAWMRGISLSATNLMLADLAMSIDFLGWDYSETGDNPSVGLFGRLDPNSDPNGDRWGYTGILNTAPPDPSQSIIRLHEYTGAGQHTIVSQPFERVDPAKDYRLVFSCVGSELTVQLFDLTDGSLIIATNAVDDSRIEGLVGFGVFEYGSGDTVDSWVDNLVVVGTTP